jgi:hypothetical protein
VPVPSYQAMAKLFDEGKLPGSQSDAFIAPRPAEELFILADDINCANNVATDPAHAKQLADLRARLAEWQQTTGDVFPGEDKLKADEVDRRTGQSLKKANPAIP